MKISIVLSTYNGEAYIEEQLESILLQTRQPDEVLIFDDGSSDKTVSIVKKYINGNGLSNWKLILNKENKGWKKNFIEGFFQTTGDIIFPCDQDDIWFSEKLQECETIMQSNSKINVLASDYIAFYDKEIPVNKLSQKDSTIKKYKLDYKLFNTRYPGCTYCFRRCMLPLLQKYWKEEFAHDAILWRLASFSDSFYVYDKPLIYWRRHNDSTYTQVSHKTRNSKRNDFKMAKKYIKTLKMFLSENTFSDKKKKKILDDNLNWVNTREKFYNTKNPLVGISLIRYLKCYARIKQYLGDWYFVYFGKIQ